METPSDKVVPGDYDGDGKTDIAVYRKATGTWYVNPSSTNTPYAVRWGGDPTDIPVPRDYDGMERRTSQSIASARAHGTSSSSAGSRAEWFGGNSADIPVTSSASIY